MAKSKFDIGDLEVIALNLGDEDVKAHLGDTLLYPLSKPIDDAVVTCASATYNGSNQTAQSITVTLSGVTLVENTDYTVTQNTGGTNAGSYPVVVTGIGNYVDSANGAFVINKADSSLSFPLSILAVEKGETKTNAATVNVGDGTVVYNSNNTTAVTVDNSGVVTGVDDGYATISAYMASTSNYNSGFTTCNAYCTIAITAKYNVTNTSNPTTIAYNVGSFRSIEIDGVQQASKSTGYTFSTTGEHTVKYYLSSGSMGYYAFYASSSLTTVIIGSGVTSIGDNVFSGCTSLTSVTCNATTPPTLGTTVFTNTNNCPIYVPCDSVDTYKAASGWSSYASRIQAIAGSCPIVAKFNVTDTSSPTRIASATTNFSSIEIDGVEQPSVTTGYTFSTTGEHTVKYTLADPTSIGSYAFCQCTSLTSITIPDSATSIGEAAFYKCKGLTSIDIPSGVTSIGNDAFQGCSSLQSINIPSGVTSIGDGIFTGCIGLTSIDIPDSVTSIGEGAFSSCYGLTSIDIPNSVTSIGYQAFQYCSGLTTCTIGSGVTSIGGQAFCQCTSLTSITIPNGVTSIGSYTFMDCRSLRSVNIGSGVTWIGYRAFQNCSGLTSIDIPDSVTSIDETAFEACYGLTSCTIGSGVTSISTSAFQHCTGLTSVTVNATTPPTLGSYVFDNTNNCPIYVPCGSINEYKAASGWSSYASRIQAIAGSCPIVAKFNVTDTSSPTTLMGYAGGTYFTKIEIDGVEQPSVVSRYTFDTLGEHTVKITLKYPTSIGYGTFYDCSNLTSIVIPDSVTSIGNEALLNCSGLTSIVIPSGVTSIGDSSFSRCTRLTSIDIPNSVTSIGNGAFNGCRGLTSCTIGSGVTSIGTSAFYGCTGLTSITIPNSVTSIGNSAFANCSGLTSIEIPNGVTSIGQSAFASCTSLTSIDIPNSVTSIGDMSFYYCRGLTSIVCNATTAPTIQSSTFQYVKTGGTLTVPIGSSGYDVWMGTGNYYLGMYNWTKVEQ